MKRKYFVDHIELVHYSDGVVSEKKLHTYITYAFSEKQAVSQIRFREKLRLGNFGMSWDESYQELLKARLA